MCRGLINCAAERIAALNFTRLAGTGDPHFSTCKKAADSPLNLVRPNARHLKCRASSNDFPGGKNDIRCLKGAAMVIGLVHSLSWGLHIIQIPRPHHHSPPNSSSTPRVLKQIHAPLSRYHTIIFPRSLFQTNNLCLII